MTAHLKKNVGGRWHYRTAQELGGGLSIWFGRVSHWLCPFAGSNLTCLHPKFIPIVLIIQDAFKYGDKNL